MTMQKHLAYETIEEMINILLAEGFSIKINRLDSDDNNEWRYEIQVLCRRDCINRYKLSIA